MLDHVTEKTQQGRSSDAGRVDRRFDGADFADRAVDNMRADRRIKTRLKGALVLDGSAASIACLVRDLSDGGAKIDVDPACQLPPDFTLEVPELNTAFHAELRWRYAQTAGLKFTSSRQLSYIEEHPTRAELITENAQLRETVEALTDRLTELGERVIDGSVLRGRVPRRLKAGSGDVGAPPKRTTKSGRTRRGEGTNSLG